MSFFLYSNTGACNSSTEKFYFRLKNFKLTKEDKLDSPLCLSASKNIRNMYQTLKKSKSFVGVVRISDKMNILKPFQFCLFIISIQHLCGMSFQYRLSINIDVQISFVNSACKKCLIFNIL